jgi:predicted transcriptional regulator
MEIKKRGKAQTYVHPMVVRITNDQHALFAEIANKRDMTITEVMREAVLSFLERESSCEKRRKAKA